MRVAVLGGGYAGLLVARALEDDLPDVADVVVVDDTGDHLVQHELHRTIRRPDLADALTVPLDDVLSRAEVRRDTVTGLDRDDRTVRLDAGGDLDYDVAAVCLGAETAYHGLPGVADRATPFKSLDDALAVRDAFLDRVVPDGTTVVGGAGLSGIQVAGELAELAGEEDADDARVVLLEREASVAPGFPDAFRRAVRSELVARGVDVRTDARVERATAGTVHLADGGVDFDQFVWTGGIRGSRALDGDRPAVRATLAVDDSTFVVGDAGRVVDAEGTPVPASAQAAVQEAETAARNATAVVEHRLDGEAGFHPRLSRFTFDASGWAVSVGDAAVAQVGPSVVTGRAARALKAGVGARYLASAGAVRRAVEVARGELE